MPSVAAYAAAAGTYGCVAAIGVVCRVAAFAAASSASAFDATCRVGWVRAANGRLIFTGVEPLLW